jgi:hypothetical protein
MSDRFDDIFEAVSSTSDTPDPSPVKKLRKSVSGSKKEPNPKKEPDSESDTKKESPTSSLVDSFWSSIDNPDTIRLNVDIPLPLNDRLSAKAKSLKQSKSELVRRLLEWVLDE